MKTTLKLGNPLWKTPERRKILDATVQQSAAELEGEIKQKILTGPKTGRLYRRGAILKAASKKLLALGLRRVKGDPKTVIAGANFHRASAPGESPASDTGGLANATRAQSTGEMKAKVFNSKNYAEPLDKGAVIPGRSKRTKIVGPLKNRVIQPRPFFESTAEEFKPKFKQNIADAIKGNS